jgi:hypothetical protein
MDNGNREPTHAARWILLQGAGLAVGIFLLVLSAVVGGIDEKTWLAVGATLLGVVLGAAMPFVRAIFVAAFSRPTKTTILERRNGDGGVTVRVVDDAGTPVAH